MAVDMLWQTWRVMAQVAPYLLFGFAMAGLLSVLIRPDFVERHLGGGGWRGVWRATVLGIPMPLCSCGVVPVAASLRRHGASRGATAAFLASTPETGVDSIVATWGVLGPVFAMARILVAIAAGFVAGILVNVTDRAAPPAGSLMPDDGPADAPRHGWRRWRRALRFGFLVLPRDIGPSLLVGLLVAGVAGTFVPAGFWADKIHSGFLSMLAALLLAIPVYVCSTGSIPIALAMMQAGFTPGAALVFLIAGPATNSTMIAATWKMLGRRAAACYLAAIVACALGGGWLFDLLTLAPGKGSGTMCPLCEITWLHHVSGVIMLLVLLAAQVVGRWKTTSVPAAVAGKEAGCCCQGK